MSSKTLMTRIYSNTDLNTITTQQICYFSLDPNMVDSCHAPRQNGWLWVIPETYQGWIKQIIFVAGTINSSDMFIYTRLYQNNQWGDWHTFMSYKKVMGCTNWAYLITLNSTNGYSVTLPNDWKEVYISTYLGASNSYVVPTYVIRRDTVELGDSTYALRTGYSTGGNTTESAQVIFGIGKQSITFLYAFKSGTDIKTTSNARVYVKLGYYFYDKVSDID